VVREFAMVSQNFIKQLEGYSLTTAEIVYYLPDHPKFLQSYIWQEYDLAPKFPILMGFLKFWQTKLEGPIHSVRVAHVGLIKPAEIKLAQIELTMH
jgi:uncharacterized protein Usg